MAVKVSCEAELLPLALHNTEQCCHYKGSAKAFTGNSQGADTPGLNILNLPSASLACQLYSCIVQFVLCIPALGI